MKKRFEEALTLVALIAFFAFMVFYRLVVFHLTNM